MPYGALSYLDTLSNFPEQQVNKIKLWKPLSSYFSYSPNRTVAGWYFFPFLTSVIWLPWGIYFENFTSFACQMKANQVVFQQSETYATNCPQGAEVSCNVLGSCGRYVMTSQPMTMLQWTPWQPSCLSFVVLPSTDFHVGRWTISTLAAAADCYLLNRTGKGKILPLNPPIPSARWLLL